MLRNNKEEADYLMSCSNIMDSVADGVFTVDKNMLITTYNRAAEEITGYSYEEAIGKPCHEIFRTELCLNDCPLKEALKESKPVVSREVYIHDKHGAWVPISVCASMLHDSEGNIIGGVETIRNLKDSSTLLDSVADGIFTFDEHMVVLSFNQAAENITGYSHDDAIGKHCYEIFSSKAYSGACLENEAIATGVSVLGREVEHIDLPTNKKFISVGTSVFVDRAGKTRGRVETIHDLSFIHTFKNELHDRFVFQNIISRNPSMRRLFDISADIAASEATVFLHGESGTGKELFARAIHDLSPRRKGPLVIVNCGALPETLLEAEIFGVRKGAYTGAVENRPGRLELCNGGTFFLDEIGDLPLQLQVKLLRVLENKEYQPLGAKNPLKADVRFITATHRNLAKMVEEGTFRRDLYFRIKIVELNIPPLRERKEDIPLLLEIAIKKFNIAYGKKVLRASPEVLKILLTHDFPGNVRELLNLIEQAVILCKGSEIGLDLMPNELLLGSNSNAQVTRRRSSKSPEAEVLCDVISRHKGNRTGAAQELGIDRSTLWRWVKSAGIEDF